MVPLEKIINETFSNAPLDILRKITINFLSNKFNNSQKEILSQKLRRYKKARISKTTGRETKRDINAIRDFIWDGIAYFWRTSLWGHPNDFDAYIKEVNTPSKAGSISIERWEYVSDTGGDYWQTPEETYNRINSLGQFQGDCDDIARFLLCGMNRSGHKAFMYVMWDNQTGHATCAIEEDGTIETIGTFHRVNHYTTNRKEAAEYWYPNLKGMIVYKQDPYSYALKQVAFIEGKSSNKSETSEFSLMKLEDFVEKMSKIDKNFESYVIKTLDKSYAKRLEKESKRGD